MKISEIKKRRSATTIGTQLFLYGEVGSTNDVLLGLFREGTAVPGAVVVADSQTEGRGRLGRKWISPAGKNLYLSVLFRPDIPARASPVFTFLASLALESVFSGYGQRISIKWPNDILASGKKICGVLTELGCSRDGGVEYLIIGIGVNLNIDSKFISGRMGDVLPKATSLSILLGREVEREEFAAKLINSLDELHSRFLCDGAAPIIEKWTKKWGFLGKEISVDTGGGTVSGIVEHVDEDGFVHVRTAEGVFEKLIAGDEVSS